MNLILTVLLAFMLGSCSVGMALHGTPDTDLSVLKTGEDRGVVRANLGSPESVSTNADTFIACRGKEGSVGRAIGHGILDFLTVGLWEVVGTPVEAISDASGDCRRIVVEYDANNKITAIR
ncbi:MAG: hypothetical protein ACT4NX_08940 [Deltaproteobacteria bacterium]